MYTVSIWEGIFINGYAFYQCITKQSHGDSDAIVKRLEQETEAKIHHLKTQAASISNDVVQVLINHVITVKK